MSELDKIISYGRLGEEIDKNYLREHLKRFDKIILRGAGAFGSELGVNLLKLGSLENKLLYWDIRAEELVKVNGIKVDKPYEEKFNAENTLVINCIPNGSTAGNRVLNEIRENNYTNVISGMGLYEAAFCPLNLKTGFNSKVCLNSKACNWCSCELLMNLLGKSEHSNCKNFKDELSFQIITFVIGLKCTLECKHCGQYLPYFPKEKKINLPFERIKKDIDIFFDSVDTVGFVSVIGGEPFVHPDLNKIIDVILSKKNFGMLGITTNGICKIKNEHLAKLKNERIRVIFSDYTSALNEKQVQLFNDNINKIKNAGINYTIGAPLWVLPTDLKKRELDEETKLKLKANCTAFVTCQTVQNGAFYPCSTATYVRDHNIAEYTSDFVSFDKASSPADLRKKIIELNNKEYYQSCEHCTGGGGMLAISGEQGFDERYAYMKNEKTCALESCPL